MDLKPILDMGELHGIRNYHYTIQGLLSDSEKFEDDYSLRSADPLISAAPRSYSPLLEPAVFPLEEEIKVVDKPSWSSPSTSHSGKRKQRRYRCNLWLFEFFFQIFILERLLVIFNWMNWNERFTRRIIPMCFLGKNLLPKLI